MTDQLTKQEIYDFFDQQISKTAIQQIEERDEWDDEQPEWVVVGKTARVTVDKTGEIDIFVCNHTNLVEGLGTGALRNRLRALEMSAAKPAVELNGEGYIKTRDKNVVFSAMRLLGIRKKVQYSEERKQKLREQLAKAKGKRND